MNFVTWTADYIIFYLKEKKSRELMSLFQSYENYGKNILNDVIFNLVKVLKGVLVLINFTLYFFALFKKKSL